MSRQDRRMKPGKDIAPLSVQNLDMLQVYLRSKVALLEPEIRRTASADVLKSTDKIDTIIKETILKDSGCPEAVRALSEERPSVYDILTSCHKYDPAKIQIFREMLSKVEKKEITSSTGYYETFKQIVPNSAQIIRDLQKEAASKKSTKAVNLQ